MALSCGRRPSWEPKVKPNLGCLSNIPISMPDILILFHPDARKMRELRPFKYQGYLVTLWLWPLTRDLENSYLVRYSSVMCNIEIWLQYSHCLTMALELASVSSDWRSAAVQNIGYALRWWYMSPIYMASQITVYSSVYSPVSSGLTSNKHERSSLPW